MQPVKVVCTIGVVAVLAMMAFPLVPAQVPDPAPVAELEIIAADPSDALSVGDTLQVPFKVRLIAGFFACYAGGEGEVTLTAQEPGTSQLKWDLPASVAVEYGIGVFGQTAFSREWDLTIDVEMSRAPMAELATLVIEARFDGASLADCHGAGPIPSAQAERPVNVTIQMPPPIDDPPGLTLPTGPDDGQEPEQSTPAPGPVVALLLVTAALVRRRRL